jgi:hypothetical protein
MKEIISAVIFIVGLYSGTVALKHFHEAVKRASLEKAAQGLPSLTEMHRTMRRTSR